MCIDPTELQVMLQVHCRNQKTVASRKLVMPYFQQLTAISIRNVLRVESGQGPLAVAPGKRVVRGEKPEARAPATGGWVVRRVVKGVEHKNDSR